MRRWLGSLVDRFLCLLGAALDPGSHEVSF